MLGGENNFLNGKKELIFLSLFCILFFQGCVQPSNSKRSNLKSASATDSKNTTVTLPTFKDGNNFIQNGIVVSTSTVNLTTTFSDFLQLRGKDVDGYIRNNGTQNVACLTSRFPSANAIVLLAAIPRSVFNFSTQSLEYYYNLAPDDLTSNQSFCQKTGLINQLFSFYPSFIPKYKLLDICPSGNCSSSSFSSLSLELFSTSGTAITQVATKQLQINLTVANASLPPSGSSCIDNSQCLSQGKDCCSSGQCVTDLALKPGVNTSSPDYLQALQDILNNPSNIYLYSQYYFLCSSSVNTPTPPTAPVNPVSDANARLNKLSNLYNCTNKIEGEYGLCTKTYTNAQLNTPYKAENDDKSFSNTFTNINIDKQTLASVEQVLYGGVVIFDYSTKDEALLFPNIYEDSLVRIEGTKNDDLASGTSVIVKTIPPGAATNDLQIRYKIDASCSQINLKLAKCEKYYFQGQENKGDTIATHRIGRVTDHFPDSNIFKLPTYADQDKTITVEVDGILQKENIDWQYVKGSISQVQFLPLNTLKIFKDQKVKISYFVNLELNNVMKSKLTALEEIKSICSCVGTNCNLAPVKNTLNQITDYACLYPDPDPTPPPLSQKIFLSSKTVPVRFFDSLGVSQKAVTGNTLPQEGLPFKYRNDNLLNPNNLPDITKPSDTSDTYVGFNEIYGSLSYTNASAKPAYEVAVNKGTTYDLFVDRGVYSNCIQCGNDYYSQLNKLFPLAQFGGGVNPLLGQTNKIVSSGIRADDMSFGRACLLPATMIPWTHNPESSNQVQRLNRLRAQHLLFANGYQYDWFGFDYGSIIGSFDGVKWFSVGSNRRIKALSNKLFLAVNGMFGDLALESTYEVTINDGTLNPLGANMNESDLTSDGAQCQQFHQCSTDNDCASTLGWDYACAPVNEITTSWPKFDDNAKEIPEASVENNSLTSILNISVSGKRCVYRGRGALCSPNYNNINLNSTFNQTTSSSLHACSANSYCQNITTNGIPVAQFNNRIVRYGKIKTDSTVDSFGYGAPIPGRPLVYNGAETVRSETLKNLNANKAFSMCLPGRDIDQTSFLEQHKSTPSFPGDFSGDKTLGIGMSYRKNTPVFAPHYLVACSIEDSSKNFYHMNASTAATSFSNNIIYPDLMFDSGSQAISTNALNIFNTIFSNKGISFNFYKNNSTVLNTLTFTENRCLRAPGSTCFTDLDCAPSKPLADKIKSLNASDASVTAILNPYEVKFWQEDLVCSQNISKTSNLYDPKNNRCCREPGKIITLPSADISNGLNMTLAPGIDYSMGNKFRYSRAATMYKETNTNSATFPELRTAIKDQCTTACQTTATLNGQYKTFAAFAEKTSCSGDWIRNFSTGNHTWSPARFQSFNPSMFRCMNWFPGNGGYTCPGDIDDPTCGIAQTSSNSPKARALFDYLGRMELMGIPQIALESESFFSSTIEEAMSCKSDPVSRSLPYPDHPDTPTLNYKPPTQLFPSILSPKEYNDPFKGNMYSAIDNTNFGSAMKQIFKADEVASCLPAGTQMKTGDDPALCCTGMINGQNLKCQLPDYSDLSIYTNRYISSEAKKLNAVLFDNNGYIRDPAQVALIACEKQMCASNTIAFGVLISKLKTPGQTSEDSKHFRFLEGNTSVDNENGLLDLYNKGLKINTHAYCIPSALGTSGNAQNDLTLFTCGSIVAP